MGSVFDGDTHSQVFVSLALIATILSSISSIIMIILIKKINVWNGHILLLLTMSWFQLLYDATFFTGVTNIGAPIVSISSNVAQITGGISSSIISNFIAIIALYVVYYKRVYRVFAHFSKIVFVSLFPSILVTLLYLMAIFSKKYEYLADIAILDLYYFIRLASIALNFGVSIFTAILINRIRTGKDYHKKSKAERAISKLSIRLLYYPLVQALSRSGCAWYEMQYGYNFSRSNGFNFNPTNTSNLEFAAQCLMVLSTPIASLGYLVIFLIMQPNAYKCLKQLALCQAISLKNIDGLSSHSVALINSIQEEDDEDEWGEESSNSLSNLDEDQLSSLLTEEDGVINDSTLHSLLSSQSSGQL